MPPAEKMMVSAIPGEPTIYRCPTTILQDYLDFLRECDVITGYEKDCLYTTNIICVLIPKSGYTSTGRWQEGLIPNFGVPDKEWKQIEDFLVIMNGYRYAKGNRTVRDAFAIPVNESSADENFTGTRPA